MNPAGEYQLCELLVHYGHSLFMRGYSSGGSDNLNVKLPDGSYLVTPINSCLSKFDLATLSRLDANGVHLSGDKPLKGVSMHLAQHRHRPSCDTVVYLYSPQLIALSCLPCSTPENCLSPPAPYCVMRVGQLPLLPYFKPGHEGVASALNEITTDHTVVSLVNHGPVVSDHSLHETVFSAGELGDGAHIWLTLKPLGYVPFLEEAVTELGYSRRARGDMVIPEQRRDFIYRYMHEKNTASFNELADLMSVSHITVRRDIQLLEEEGKVIAINGGVKFNSLLKSELPWREKAELNHDAKRRMGQLAAMFVEPGQMPYLDAGTSLFEVAKAVAASHCSNLMVVTGDFPISHYLMGMPHITLYHTGGLVDQRNRSYLSKSVASLLRTISIDVTFLSSSSQDTEHDMSTLSKGKASVKEAVPAASRRRVLVCDSSKFNKYGMFHIYRLKQLTDITSNNRLPESAQQTIVSQGIKLHLVDGREGARRAEVNG